LLQDRSAADEPDAGDQAFKDASLTKRLPTKNGYRYEHKATAGDGNEWKGANAGASLLFFSIPANRKSQNIGDQKTEKV